jgi:HK97 family phage portal protein
MIQEWDAESAIKWAYIANTYVYRCVDAISTAIATCPFRACDPEDEMDYSLLSPLAQLLGPPPGGPNPSLSPRRLWKWTVAQRLITGRWCWEVERASQSATTGKVLGLWPLPTHLVDPVPSTKGRRYFDEFIYNKNGGQKKRTFKPEQLVYDWNPSQSDIRQPESVLQAARLDISVAVMQDRYDVAFLKNDARPAAVIVHEEFAERDEREAFRQQFLADYRGVDNAGRPIFIEATPGEDEINRTFHIERLGLSQKDAEFIARYETKVRAICVAFGTPLSILGDSSARSFDNAGQEYRNWWEGTLLPLQAELEDAVNMQLAPILGREIGKFETKHVAALMRSSKILSLGGAIPQFVQAGIITNNEVRRELDLPPLDEVAPSSAPEMDDSPDDDELPSTDQEAPVAETGRTQPLEAPARTRDNNEDVNLERSGAYEVRDAGPFTPPQGVREEAQRAVKWIDEGHAGGGFTAVGRRRASQLANGSPVSREIIGRMASYFARHEVDKKGQGWSPDESGYPSPGRVAWAAWGGDPGWSWAKGIMAQDEGSRSAFDEYEVRDIVRVLEDEDGRIVLERLGT